ncbi:MAG TPA: hypothetical protein VMP01_02030 [Pirellulaceae bacterium]|nr:hypothetical protein [Pirellulaceae bacterium]
MCRSLLPRKPRLLAVAALLVLAAVGSLRAQGPPADPLEAYLQKLGLSDLRVRHLERLATEEHGRESKLAAGRKLADAYAERLMALAEDEAAFKAMKQRVDQLLAQLPEAKTPTLTVMLLQADFQRAESLVNTWLEESAEPETQRPHEAINILTRIVPELETRIKEIHDAAERLLSRADDLMETKSAKQTEEEVFRLQSVAARATYFAGWGHYYLGLTQQAPAAASGAFNAAKRHFSDVLGVDDAKDYAPVEVDSLGLESVWRARTAIGLGLAESALGRPAAAAACFRWLDHASAPANLRDEASYWQLKGLLNVRDYEAAAELAELKIAALAAPPTPGKNSFCTALIRAGASPGSGADPAAHVAKGKLALAGIAGLARLRQFDTLGQLVTKHKLYELPEARDSFYLTWLNGRAQFLAAEKTKHRDDYTAAAATLEKALAQSAARQDLFAAGQCRYHLAWCKFRLEEFEEAAQAFREVTPVLKEGEEDLAAQANWMEFAAWQSLAQKKKEPRFAAAAVTALETLKRDFPASEQAGKADIYIARLRQDVVPEKAIESLLRVKPGDASYLAAQFEIVTLRHKIWNEASGEKRADENLASELLAAVDRFLGAAGTSGRPDERLRASLIAIEVLSAQSGSEQGEIERYLNRAQRAARSLADSSPLLAEYHYRRLQHAQRTKDDAELRRAADWIAMHGGGTPYELPALIIVARQADAAVDAASAGDKRARQEEAAAIYQRLTKLIGDSPEAIAGTKNALAVSSRLAAYDESLGRWKEAAARLDKIVAALPSDKKYLRRAGIAHVQAGHLAAAAGHWRTLLAGLKGGSDEWLEAKHYQITCLLETDPAAAQKVWKQFKLLYPEVKSAAWREKFAALEQRLDRK